MNARIPDRVERGENVCGVTQSTLNLADFPFVPGQYSGDRERRTFCIQRGHIGVMEKVSCATQCARQFICRRSAFFAKSVDARLPLASQLTKSRCKGMLD